METATLLVCLAMTVCFCVGFVLTIVDGIQSIKLARQIRLKIEELKIKDLEITKK